MDIRSRSSRARAWEPVLLALVIFGLAFAGSFFSSRRLLVDPAGPQFATAAGLFAIEPGPQGQALRWTNGAALFALPNPGGSLRLDLTLASGPQSSIPVTLTTGPHRLAWEVSGPPRQYRLLLPAQVTEQLQFTLGSPTFRPADDARDLGVQVGALRLQGAGPRWPLALGFAGLALLAGYLWRVAGVGRWPSLALAALGPLALLVWEWNNGWQTALLGPSALLIAGFTMLATLLVWLWQARPRQPHETFFGVWPPLPLLGLLFGASLAAALWTHFQLNQTLTLDLGIYLAAAQTALAGGNPYEPFLIGVSYVYPPPALALFAPFERFPIAIAAPLWQTLSALAYLAALLALWLWLRPRQGLAAPLLLVAALLYAPWWENQAIGQVNTLLLLAIVLFGYGHQQPRAAWLGDLALAGAILLKITPIVFLAVPFLRGDWPRLARVALGLFLLSLLAYPWFGWETWQAFIAILPRLLEGSNANPFNLALSAQLHPWVGRAFTIGLLGLWLWAAWHWRFRPTPSLFALGTLVMALASSLIWYHHLVFLLFPLAWLLLGSPRSFSIIAATTLALLAIQFNRPLEFGLGLPPWAAVIGYSTIFALSLALLWRERTSPLVSESL